MVWKHGNTPGRAWRKQEKKNKIMKKFLLSLVLAVSLVAGALAQSNQLPVDAGTPKLGRDQVGAQSTTITMTERGFDLLWLNDGYESLSAISYTIAPIKGTNGRLRLQALGAGNPGNLNEKAYLTLGLGYNLFNSASGFRVDLFAGPKGFNVADGFKLASGKASFVFGVGFSIPLGN